MDSIQQVRTAARILGLGEKASMYDIRAAYRKLAMKYHPDRGGAGSDRVMAEITAAYDTVRHYCEYYQISFASQEMQLNETEWWLKHFGENM